MKKILILLSVAAGMSAFAEMGLVPINQLIKRGKTNAMLVARNAKIVDITRVAGYMAGKQMGENAPVAPVYAEGYFPIYRNDKNNTGLGFELQTKSEYLQKTVSANIIFYEQDNDLYVYLYQFKTTGNEVAKSNTYSSQKTDGSNINGAGSYLEPSTSIDGENPCLCGLRVWLAGRDRVANWGFLGSSERTLWGGVSLTELVDFSGVFTGSYSPYLMHLFGYNVRDTDGVKTTQLQCWGTNDMTRAVFVDMKSSESGIVAGMTQAKRTNAGDGFKIGRNLDYLNGSQNLVETDNGSGISVRGLEARIEKRSSTPKYAKYLPTKENQAVIWENVSLADVISINGDMNGGWMAVGQNRRPFHLVFGDGQITVQFQAISDTRLFCVKSVFVQKGGNVEGYIEYARYVDLPTEGVGLGFDFDSSDNRIKDNKIQTSDNGDGYGGYGLKNVSAMLIPKGGADTFIYKGAAADGRLSYAGNWVGGVAPSEGAKLYFRDPTPNVIVNDYAENTFFEGLYFAGSGSNTVEFTGNALRVATIDNLSEDASVHVSAPVVCGGNFEPWVGGGMLIESLDVAGTLAPRGKRTLGPLGTVRAAMLSGGNIHAWEGDVYGLGGAFVRRTLNGAANASFGYLDTAGFTREVFEISGTNTVANRLELPNGQIFAIKKGLVSVPDIGSSGDDPHINLSAEAQLHIRDYKNQYDRPVRFEGMGRVSFGANGYAADMADVFDGVAFGTAGTDYTVAGSAMPGADGKLRFAAVDPDGTVRAITFASESAVAADLEVVSGILKAGRAALEGRKLTVAGGFYEPIGEKVEVSSIEFSGVSGLAATEGKEVELQMSSISGMPNSYYFTAGSSISMPNGMINLDGATVVFDAPYGTKTDVLKVSSISGSPGRVVSALTGKATPYSIEEKNGLSVLTVVSASPSLKIIVR